MKPVPFDYVRADSLSEALDVLAGEVGGLRPRFVLLQHRDDLLFRDPCSLHLSVLVRAGL